MKKLLLACLLVIVSATYGHAVTRYADNTLPGTCSNGSTTYDPTADSGAGACGGGTATIYSSITNCVNAMASGDTCEVRAGTYNETLDNQIPSGTGPGSGHTVLTRYSNELVTWQPTGSASGSIIRATSSRQYITISSMKFDCQSMPDDGRRVWRADASGINTISDIWIYNNEMVNCRSNIQAGADIVQGTEYGMKISYNYIHDGGYNGAQNLSRNCAYLQGDGIIFEHNYCINILGFGVTIFNGNQFGGSPTDNIVRYNYFDNVGGGSGAGGSTEIVINNSGTNTLIYNNIITNAVDRGIQTDGSGVNAKIFNNVIYNSGLAGIYFWNSPNPVLANNIIANNTPNITQDGGTSTQTTNSTSAACMIDPANGNFNLVESSACIDAGTVMTGFSEGRYVGSAPDQGAFEAPIQSTGSVESGDQSVAQITWLLPSQGVRNGTGLQSCDFTDFALEHNAVGLTEDACAITGTNRTDVGATANFINTPFTALYTRPSSGPLTDNVGIGCGKDDAFCQHAQARTFSSALTLTDNTGGGPSVTWTSIHYRCLSYYSDTSPAATDWLRAEDAINSTADTRCPIRAGGVAAVAIGVQVTAANPDNATFAWYANRNGGAYSAMTNTQSDTALSFANASPPNMSDTESIASAILTSPTNYVAGNVVAQQASSPTLDLAQNDDFQVIIVVRIGSGAAVGDDFCVRAALSGQTETSVTATQFPCFEVVQPAAGY